MAESIKEGTVEASRNGGLTQELVIVTGPSGAGRSTAISALEDLGFEAIDNLPLSLLDRLLDGQPLDHPLALGIDVRNRDFAVLALEALLDRLAVDPRIACSLLYLDCDRTTLLRRFSETRRRHPLAPGTAPDAGIAAEVAVLAPLRARADVLIDTSELSPNDLRAEIARWFTISGSGRLAVAIASFSYKRGLPRGCDLVFDCRFLRNPHWQPDLRTRDGRDPDVIRHVEDDPRFRPFFERVMGLLQLLLPAYRDEGRAYLGIGLGCTGGRHRSVAMAGRLADALADEGWAVSLRHRELEGAIAPAPFLAGGAA